MKNILFLFAILMSYYAHGDFSMPVSAKSCTLCHGPTGSPSTDVVPRIAGLPKAYIVEELLAYKNGLRHNKDASFMTPEVKKMTQGEISEVAKYYSEQHPRILPDLANPELMAKGKKIFEEGIPEKGVVSCNGCHSADGTEIFGPPIARQYSFYFVRQIEAFQTGTRKNATTMPDLVKMLDIDSAVALGHYLESL